MKGMRKCRNTEIQKRETEVQMDLGVEGTAQIWVGTAECLRAWATQGHWDHTVARIKIWRKCGRKVILREGVDGKAMVCDIIKGDSASLVV